MVDSKIDLHSLLPFFEHTDDPHFKAEVFKIADLAGIKTTCSIGNRYASYFASEIELNYISAPIQSVASEVRRLLFEQCISEETRDG